ncbi:glycine--tRNA ligase subunit beta [Siminovitchia sp. FSL H7-0308]|uniref:Glycine--tRNA ligase beta subunit n=1 Tax=Siminovitchia thermophila TaxID=1245522 RepID=A0ABS2RBT8_9BACI|nr:glycine--tRNA ligase subunit beta [Siminovitchia thermophila]MBM7716293.1 glycyl-tRNA synthetase beta chain [Siminovitchia thermophila]ONK24214.1 glycine--tRNA ligase subunit beta [Bacillus sp. VT-16-64]
MSKRDILLEIGMEEMPARFIREAIRQLEEKVINWLDEHHISHGGAQSFSTPRRLAVIIREAAEKQDDSEEEMKGPAKKIALDKDGNWSKAAIGFSRSNGMTTDDIYFKEIKGTEYAHVKRFIQGKKTIDLLPELEHIVTGLHFPNNMRWANHSIKYVRPIRWLVAMFGKEAVSFSVAGVQTDVVTRGHRFLGSQATISTPADYEKSLLDQYVIADDEKRKQMILEQIKQLEVERNWVVPTDEDLLEEVTNLVEYPTVFFGSFEESFLSLPEEVLITSMKSHQRYFPVRDRSGQLLPYFVSVRNGDSRYIETVMKGNEKVLRARLADAEFFFEEDKKLDIDVALNKLENIIYHEKIGTLAGKVKRIRKITKEICQDLHLSKEEQELADRAASICKFDLITNMVDEFPELQGIMGEKYALQKGESVQVAQAIREHYMPRHAHDRIPELTIGGVVGLADKLDTIVASFAIGLIPTGSQDPYALRRSAAGIIHILLDKNWNLSITNLLKQTIAIIQEDAIGQSEGLLKNLLEFFQLRMKFMLQERGIRHDIIDAVLGGEMNGAPDIVDRAKTLNEQKDKPDFKETIESLARVLNIARKAEPAGEIDPSLFKNGEEQILYDKYEELREIFQSRPDARARFSALKQLQPAITAYFDHTMVMAEDSAIRNNRLSQMKKLADLIGSFAQINEIHVK